MAWSDSPINFRQLIRYLPLAAALLVALPVDGLPVPRDPAPRLLVPGPRATQGHLLAARSSRRHRPKARPKRPKTPLNTEPDAQTESPKPAASSNRNLAGTTASPADLQRGGRVEFDGRLVQGQTAKSGAIYLFARQRTDLRSMVRERDSYRREILRTVYPDWNK